MDKFSTPQGHPRRRSDSDHQGSLHIDCRQHRLLRRVHGQRPRQLRPRPSRRRHHEPMPDRPRQPVATITRRSQAVATNMRMHGHDHDQRLQPWPRLRAVATTTATATTPYSSQWMRSITKWVSHRVSTIFFGTAQLPRPKAADQFTDDEVGTAGRISTDATAKWPRWARPTVYRPTRLDNLAGTSSYQPAKKQDNNTLSNQIEYQHCRPYDHEIRCHRTYGFSGGTEHLQQ
jgi:hypothetical protein